MEPATSSRLETVRRSRRSTVVGARTPSCTELPGCRASFIRTAPKPASILASECGCKLDLYANVRPIKLLPGIVSPLRNRFSPGQIDYTIIRENSEGLYASRGAGAVVREEMAVDMLIVTRKGVERVLPHRFRDSPARARALLLDGKRRVTCCDKGNVLRSLAFFRRVFDRGGVPDYPDVEKDYSYVDAMTVHLVRADRTSTTSSLRKICSAISSPISVLRHGRRNGHVADGGTRRPATVSFRPPTVQHRPSPVRVSPIHIGTILYPPP